MKRLLFLILLFITFEELNAQNFFVPEFKFTTKPDTALSNLKERRTDLDFKLTKIINNILYKNSESKSIDSLYYNIEGGQTDWIVEQIQTDSTIKKVILRNNLSPTELYNFANNFNKINNEINWFYNIQSVNNLNKATIISGIKHNELKKYNFKNGDKILEIGSGNFDFARNMIRKLKNSEIYLNDIDTNPLNHMYLTLQLDRKLIKKYIGKRHNKVYLIKGTEKSTGVENIIFDKIIVRNALHCFSEKELMLESIKKSMDENTIVIINDKFNTGKESQCPQLMLQKDFEELMQQNGFLKLYSKRMKNKYGDFFWLYKFKKNLSLKSS